MSRNDVRILLVGDDKVGKSSIVTSLIKDAFIPNVQHVIPEITIPPEVTPENVVTYIVDSSAHKENREQLNSEIRKADVICVVYAVDNKESFDRISSFWIPYIRTIRNNISIILVGNKIDVRGENTTNENLKEEIMPILKNFKEIETCIECSAKSNINISEVIYFAQKAILYPTAPIYDSQINALKPECVKALSRIFKLCDLKNNGILSDEEIMKFQKYCFSQPLSEEELFQVKEIIKENYPEGISENGLTQNGFLFLHKLFICQGSVETTWKVLRKYGYDDDLSFREDFIHPKMDIPEECKIELKKDGYEFLKNLFNKYDKNHDGALNPLELDELFSLTPGNPWASMDIQQSFITDKNGNITLQGFLSQWSLITWLDYKVTLEYLAYFGYDNITSVLKIISMSKKHHKRNKKLKRNVYSCCVLGATGSGKTSLLKGLINKPFTESYQTTTKRFCVANSLMIGDGKKYLIMDEVGPKYDSELLSSKKRLDTYDVLVFIYDSSDIHSFAYIANLRKQYNLTGYPIVYISTKNDCVAVEQGYEEQPDEYCRNIGLSIPVRISLKTNTLSDVYNLIVGIGMNPKIAISSYRQNLNQIPKLVAYATLTATSAAIIAGILGYKMMKPVE
ncbi:mitochondrial Rho GTPase [Neocallimastix lanati (nom. inval.)]|jgi:Ras family protein T1|nr:mitochondrial Rho GTPase [Neocallimastix sp. JGI-2020a]